jgi:hypothetical protein
MLEGKNRAQGMVRSMDQWRNMVPKAVAEGSQAQVEYALVDAKRDIEALWSALSTLAASNMPVGGGYVPYLWQCKDYMDGWISYADREEALAYQRDTGCLLRVTYRPLAASGESSR